MYDVEVPEYRTKQAEVETVIRLLPDSIGKYDALSVEENSVDKEVKRVVVKIQEYGLDSKLFQLLTELDKVQMFNNGNLDFSVTCKVYVAIMKELVIKSVGLEKYDEFQKIYDATLRMEIPKDLKRISRKYKKSKKQGS